MLRAVGGFEVLDCPFLDYLLFLGVVYIVH